MPKSTSHQAYVNERSAFDRKWFKASPAARQLLSFPDFETWKLSNKMANDEEARAEARSARSR